MRNNTNKTMKKINKNEIKQNFNKNNIMILIIMKKKKILLIIKMKII